MIHDRIAETLVEALKRAMAEPAEQRLFKSGKLAGLFAGRGGVNSEAAQRAVGEGLLEVVRTEHRGKIAIEWVRLTPRGVDFIHDHESPVRALQELRAVLETTQAGVPLWLEDMQRELQSVAARLTEDVQRLLHRLDVLGQRVEEALRRADAAAVQAPNGLEEGVPWAREALAYLDRRRSGGATSDCPLPELFAALRQRRADLSVTSFHEGLRRLQDRRALQLLPFTGPPSTLPEPEYALLDGGTMLYYAAR